MPTRLSAHQHLAALAAAGERLAACAQAAGSAASVPTCPAWTIDQLVAHLGTVHRWAAANLRGEDADALPSQTTSLAEQVDILSWYRSGLASLLAAFDEVDEDVGAMVFLHDAPAPRHFWARRQAHETTIHSIDALAAVFGRLPNSEEAAVDHQLALDGIDELLGGFVPRPGGKVRSDVPYTIAVRPTDADRSWILHVSRDPVVVELDVRRPTDALFSATAVQLYLGLWNRGDEIAASGRPAVIDQWRQQQRVRWT